MPERDAELHELTRLIAARLGLHFPRERWQELNLALAGAAAELGYADVAACVRGLLASGVALRGELDALIRHLTIGETYFFRDAPSFELLEQRVIPELVRARLGAERGLRVWSAGCSTGEEPYSIAIALTRSIPDLAQWDIAIEATDLNAQALKRAAQGVYGEWSFRGTRPELRELFFRRTPEGRYQIDPRIQEMVRFSPHNLAQPSALAPFPARAFDLIFCRNVLMYFCAERSRQALAQLTAALRPGGWLFLSAVETSHVSNRDLEMLTFGDALAYRKRAAPMAEATYAVAWAPAPQPASKLRPLPPQSASVPAPSGDTQGQLDARAMGELATEHANAGRLDVARLWCEKAMHADKLSARWPLLLAAVLQEQGQLDDAVTALKRALYLDPSAAAAHFTLGNLMRQQGALEQSARCYRNALSLLSAREPDEPLVESEGLTAGGLADIIRSTLRGSSPP
jgi:chemotaxis protein methyltransferase CheR